MAAGSEDGKPPPAKVPPLVMFRFADCTDAALMAVGTVAAMANGMAEPLMTLVFAAIIECFGDGDDATVLHRLYIDGSDVRVGRGTKSPRLGSEGDEYYASTD
ncbi:hypothetical protein HU200_036997 [Digitaria exilis]|uniref:Uncharacterized protein n=1 Tax=Digitaria exilis TaxID=1010633 RepID=A0A835BFB9_9POAL|nr:hypothetical protein HU200_036997 [Digitaria exilis]